LDRNECLYHDILYLLVYTRYIQTHLSESLEYRLQRSFVSLVRIRILRCLEVGVVLVDGVVGQVDERVIVGLESELLSRKSGKALVMNEDAQRVHVRHQHVDSQIKFEFVN